MGSYLAIQNNTPDVWFIKVGCELNPNGNSLPLKIEQLSDLEEELKKDGYIKLSPGDTHKHGKVTLSLIMQCVCKKLAVESQTAVVIETVIMSPVMSGAIDGEVKLETIHSWIGKSATHKEKILFS